MKKEPHSCPACGRDFESILDYPRVRVISFERLPIPEAVDTMSRAAASKRLARRREKPGDEYELSADGINMTPAIERACNTVVARDYFERLANAIGREVSPRELLPPLEPHCRFKWAFPVADSGIYLSLAESEVAFEEGRVAEVRVHCDGPNLGSAGGPTLQLLGAVARFEYEGMLKT
jgi:hypothetical protein